MYNIPLINSLGEGEGLYGKYLFKISLLVRFFIVRILFDIFHSICESDTSLLFLIYISLILET